MKKLSIIALAVILIVGFIWVDRKLEGREDKEPIQTSIAKPDGPNYGELGPYFTGSEFHYIGTFYGSNFAYIMQDEAGQLSSDLRDNKKVTDVWTARESFVALVQQISSKKFAVLDPTDPKTKDMQFDELKYQTVPQDSDAAKAWAKVNSSQLSSKDKKKGKTQNWLYVGVSSTSTGVKKIYVGDKVFTKEEYGVRYTPMLEIVEERLTMYVDPTNRKFAPVKTDMLGTPLEETQYRDITPGGLGEAVLKTINASE